MSDIAETRARLQRAIVRLEENQKRYGSKYHHEYVRLSGKIDGVKLALSYLEEQ